jgi:hypothetical protein
LGEKLNGQVRMLMRSRAAAGVLLLALTAHAFVAGATHFHRVVQPGTGFTQTAIQGSEEHGQGVPLGADERQCLLCRLQRNLVADLQHAALVIVAPPAPKPLPELLLEAAARPGAMLLRQGRAPPAVQS